MADLTRLTLLKRGSYADSRAKRAYDLILAVGLLVLSAPVLLPAILLNMFFTDGRPIFVQRRAGKNGKEFSLFKLRTMRVQRDGEAWSHRTVVDDGRLTFFGQLLRRSYVDELPQLFNVITGHMSMIGPRPETPETTAAITNSKSRFIERTVVKPGISGVAQVFFRKPESDHDLWRRYYYDHVYIVNSSLRYDLELTVRTVWHVLRNKGH